MTEFEQQVAEALKSSAPTMVDVLKRAGDWQRRIADERKDATEGWELLEYACLKLADMELRHEGDAPRVAAAIERGPKTIVVAAERVYRAALNVSPLNGELAAAIEALYKAAGETSDAGLAALRGEKP